jgi:hypothetical protein
VDKIASTKVMAVVYNCKDSGMLDKGIIHCTIKTSTGEITSRGVCKLDRQFHRQRVREADSSNFGLNGLTAEAFRFLCVNERSHKAHRLAETCEENLVLNLNWIRHTLHEDRRIIRKRCICFGTVYKTCFYHTVSILTCYTQVLRLEGCVIFICTASNGNDA